MDVVSRWRLVGLGLLVVTAALVAAVVAGGPEVLSVLAIVLGVAGLGCLRAGQWVRKTRALTEVGLDLHVPEPDER